MSAYWSIDYIQGEAEYWYTPDEVDEGNRLGKNWKLSIPDSAYDITGRTPDEVAAKLAKALRLPNNSHNGFNPAFEEDQEATITGDWLVTRDGKVASRAEEMALDRGEVELWNLNIYVLLKYNESDWFKYTEDELI